MPDAPTYSQTGPVIHDNFGALIATCPTTDGATRVLAALNARAEIVTERQRLAAQCEQFALRQRQEAKRLKEGLG